MADHYKNICFMIIITQKYIDVFSNVVRSDSFFPQWLIIQKMRVIEIEKLRLNLNSLEPTAW